MPLLGCYVQVSDFGYVVGLLPGEVVARYWYPGPLRWTSWSPCWPPSTCFPSIRCSVTCRLRSASSRRLGVRAGRTWRSADRLQYETRSWPGAEDAGVGEPALTGPSGVKLASTPAGGSLSELTIIVVSQVGWRVSAGRDDGPPGHTSAMHAVEAVLVAESRLGEVGEVSRVVSLSGEHWLAQRTLVNELVVVDGQLTPIWRVGLPAGRLGSAAVAEDLSLVAVPRDGHLVLLDGTGRQLASFPGSPSEKPSSGCSCAVFTDDAYLWAVVLCRAGGRALPRQCSSAAQIAPPTPQTRRPSDKWRGKAAPTGAGGGRAGASGAAGQRRWSSRRPAALRPLTRAHSVPRRSVFTTLPSAFRGSASTKWTRDGTL